MPSTFARVVREQGLDRRGPNSRRLKAQALMTLAHRKRTGTLRGPIKLNWWQRLQRAYHRVLR